MAITFHHLLWPLLFSEPGRWKEHMRSCVQGARNVLGTAANTARTVLFNHWHFQGETRTSSGILFCCIVGGFFFFLACFFFSYKVAKA